MGLSIYHSKASLPYIKLGENTLTVQPNKNVLLQSEKEKDEIEILKNRRYVNLDKANQVLSKEEFKTLLEILNNNYLLEDYLVENNLVLEDNNVFYPKAPDSRLHKHIIGKLDSKGGNIFDWTELTINSPRPQKVKCKYKAGTIFSLEGNVWVLVKTEVDLSITVLLCIKGNKQGRLEEYMTKFINELYPAEVIIEVI